MIASNNRIVGIDRLTSADGSDKLGRLGDEDADDDLLCEALLILEDYQPEENQGV
jgi:hypothetical protein